MIDDLNHRHDVRLVLDDTLYYDISEVKLAWVKDERYWVMGGPMQHSVMSSQVVNGHHTDGKAIEEELSVPHEYVRLQKK